LFLETTSDEPSLSNFQRFESEGFLWTAESTAGATNATVLIDDRHYHTDRFGFFILKIEGTKDFSGARFKTAAATYAFFRIDGLDESWHPLFPAKVCSC